MKILLIHNYYQYRGGEDIYFDLLIKLLKTKGHKVISYTKNSKDIRDDFISKAKVTINMFKNNKVEKELTNIIKKFKPDIAHFGNIFPLITPSAYQVCKKTNLPIVQTIQTYKYMCPKGTLNRNGNTCEFCIRKHSFYPSIIYKCYHYSRIASLFFNLSFIFHNTIEQFKSVNKFIFPAKMARDYYIRYLDIPLQKTAIIPYFVENFNFNKKEKNNKKNIFIFAGRFSEEKRIIELIKTFCLLPRIKLIVIGDGPLRNQISLYKKYKNIIVKSFLPRKIIFKYMQSALFTVINSSPMYEFGPLVLIESFMNGTPVIAPNVGIFHERIIDNKTGLLFKSGDFNDLRQKILNSINNYDFLSYMSKQARKEYEKKYMPDIHYKALLAIYKDVLQKN